MNFLMQIRASLRELTLNNAAVWDKERARQKRPDHPKAPWFISGPYLALCWVLDVIYDERPIERFWFLETVARMPYFAYISMLHLYESLGWWRAGAELRRVSFLVENFSNFCYMISYSLRFTVKNWRVGQGLEVSRSKYRFQRASSPEYNFFWLPCKLLETGSTWYSRTQHHSRPNHDEFDLCCS